MKFSPVTSLVLVAILTGCLVFPATAALPGGGTALIFQCDSLSSTSCTANGAQVSIDGTNVGTISGGQLEIPYVSTYSTYTISKDGYYDVSGSVPQPSPGSTGDLTVTVSMTMKPVGTGKGWLRVNTNVADGSVAFNGISQGTMSGVTVKSFEVSTTGTPYTTFTVSRNGYVTYEGAISRMPSDGETVDLYATLNPVATTTVPTPAPSPVGGDMGWYAVHANVDGASVYFDSTYKGTVSNGVLSVPVYTTATPFKTYRVDKGGYVTVSGNLPTAPAKGQTVDVWVTLSPYTYQTTAVPTTGAMPGSGKGYIAIHCPVEGAKVMIGSTSAGFIHNGVLTVPVSTTGTPFSEFTVEKDGYATTTGTIPRQPAAGETVDVYVTMNPAPAPVPTKSPVPVPVVLIGLAGAVLALAVRRNE